MCIILAIPLIVILLLLGLWGEHHVHPELGLHECSTQLRHDIGTVIKGLLSGDQPRHVFDEALAEGFISILQDYQAPGLETIIEVHDATGRLPPCIEITLIPNYVKDEETTSILLERLVIKLRRYCAIYNLPWLSFGVFTHVKNRARFLLYYSELPDDHAKLLMRYEDVIKTKASDDFGVLHDDKLDEELKNVNTHRV